ncbi:hypothetical protein LOTGIDRAFT_172209 [Lottia gigantea]|uniref:Uncharacterized protein n=1 Tax=Lottia gigantea TaxID=225164 RepID=V4AE95_LOTGI|nr:hypothetical protein LOTGIDRAFT_172209 [Lottia gigantea]ESP02329.1 hypothetical protein LOTGIDRAFT_172209 [Lottia gigantea]
MEEIETKGVAYLCFNDEGTRFYGSLINPESKNQYGLCGKCVDKATGNTDIHECCIGDHTKVMTITVIDYNQNNNEHLFVDVMKTGGDNCSLVSTNLSFITDELLVDAKAEEVISKYFPETLKNQNCYVCVGDMTLSIQKQITKEKQTVQKSCCH